MYQIQSLLKQQRVVKIKIILIWLLFFVGGETIRNIIKASGAHVELNRNIPESSPTKCFMIRGIKNKMCFHRKLFFSLFIVPRISMLKWSIWTTVVKNFCEGKIKQLELRKKLVGPRFKSFTVLLSWMFLNHQAIQPSYGELVVCLVHFLSCKKSECFPGLWQIFKQKTSAAESC